MFLKIKLSLLGLVFLAQAAEGVVYFNIDFSSPPHQVGSQPTYGGGPDRPTGLFAVANSVYDVAWRAKLPRLIWQERDNETMMGAYFSPDGSLFARLNNGDKFYLHDTRIVDFASGEIRRYLSPPNPTA